MADADKDLINEALDFVVDNVADLAPFVTHPKQMAAGKTALVYGKTMNALTQAGTLAAAAAVVSSTLAAGGPVISTEQPLRRPEEHQVAQIQADDATLQDIAMYQSTGPSVSVTGTARSITRAYGDLKVGYVRRYGFRP